MRYPILAWADHTPSDRERMRRVLALFDEPGTIDEMGLGVVRDLFSDALFPGTSSIQTRLRYVFFIPWLYQRLRREKASTIADKARQAELHLIAPLMNNADNEGALGSSAGFELKRLPSGVYWAALGRWGIFLRPQSRAQYHRRFRRRGVRAQDTPDDPGVRWAADPAWHRRLPRAPEDFPEVASFALTSDEAQFVQTRWAERCPGSLLAHLAQVEVGRVFSPDEPLWSLPELQEGLPVRLERIVSMARRFALLVHGAPLLYNRMLAEKRANEDDSARADGYDARLARWAVQWAAEEPFDLEDLWRFAAERGVVPNWRLRTFLERWTALVGEHGPAAAVALPETRRLVRGREFELKGARSRLENPTRLTTWTGDAGTSRMEYRWFRVRTMLSDLHRGIGQGG